MVETTACDGCGTEIAAGMVVCPACHRLVHAPRLRELADAAERAVQGGDPRGALVAWREALELLPPGSRQYDVVAAKVADLGRQADRAPRPLTTSGAAPDPSGGKPGGWSGLAGAGAVVLFVLTKAKFLLLGLTKASTFLTMFLAFGVYWTAFGWRFALGLLLSIYVHEMGHVFLLNRYGIRASAPMFIPGFGALIRLYQECTDVRQDARVGLAGPEWGLAAALACFAGSVALGSPALASVAKMGAVLNMFNLIPIWQLDGGRGFRALSRPQRWLATTAVALAWSLTGDGLLFFVMAGGVYRAAVEPGSAAADRGVLVRYVALVAALSALMTIPVAL